MKKLMWLMIAAALPLLAKLAPAPVFVDNAVLQRNMLVPVWGTANPGEEISVTFGGQEVKTKTTADGKWLLRLSPMEASAVNRSMVIKGADETITINNVLVGEVWLCSGQSNMELTLSRNYDAEKHMAAGANKLIRFAHLNKHEWSKMARVDYPMQWQEMRADNTARLSGCAFFFGHELQRELGIPIGLICSYWGGTRIEPWTPPCGFDTVPELASLAATVNAKVPGTESYKAITAQLVKAFEDWKVKYQAALAAGEELPRPPVYPAALKWSDGPNGQQQPATLYNRMIYPFVPYAIKGAIWYQGCANVGEGMLYRYKMQALFNGWKTVFCNPDLKFYFVQLAPYRYGGDPARLPGIWEAQEAFAEANAPAVGMAVINDVGNILDIHPQDKLTVGKRLAALTLKRDYGKTYLKADAPVALDAKFEGGKAIVTFKNVESWHTKDNQRIRNFQLAGIDCVYYPADAVIDGAKIVVTSKDVKEPRAVRYMWHQLNEASLLNEAGLPLGAFRRGGTNVNDVKAFVEKEHRLVYELDVFKPVKADGKSANYVTDNSANVKDFSRVCYLVVGKRRDGNVQWLTVDMDAFTNDVAKIGYPIVGEPLGLQVKNLEVMSNVAGILGGRHAVGSIEFWQSNYGTQNKYNVPGADAGKYDFGDEPSSPDLGYGCMQVHLFQERQTLFAFNNFRAANKDFGFGNNTVTTHSDWTFRGNLSADFASATIYVYVK